MSKNEKLQKDALERQIDELLSNSKLSGKKPLLVIIGPTASGKTDLSLAFAGLYPSEIISADSRQIYRHMDIGTGKVSKAEMQKVKHHLIDIVEPDEVFHLADFKSQAEKLIDQIQNQSKLPILVGGTGLYISSIIENYILPDVKPDFNLRQELEKIAETKGKDNLFEILKSIDPSAANSIHPNNIRYVIRAIELAKSKVSNSPKKSECKHEYVLLTPSVERSDLYQRIEQRIDKMLLNGLEEEVKKLLSLGYDQSLPSMTSLGYMEIIKFLNGEWTRDFAIEKFKTHSRNYAKRQLTWFRRYKNTKYL